MRADFTYIQPCKNKVRHLTLFYAVDLLTARRNTSCCVERSYVREIYDYFMSLEESREKQETEKINPQYISSWEKLHDSCVGHKKPEDLVVCYLSGPEPQNDFDELVSLGILPHNIWAFENHNETYLRALSFYKEQTFPQPKIVKTPIEHFFKYTPKKFDIVYIDACGSIPSTQHALRCVSSLFKYHRLNSPGIIITNFARPDTCDSKDVQALREIISYYLWVKDNPNENVRINDNRITASSLDEMREKVNADFDHMYGEFINGTIRDISSVLIPVQRFINSKYLSIIAPDNIDSKKVTLSYINSINNNSLYKYSAILEFIKNTDSTSLQKKIKILFNEFAGIDGFSLDLFESFHKLSVLKSNPSALSNEIKEIQEYFENKQGIYQFLDKPNSNLFFDLIINQFSFPMHYNSERILKYTYKAKSTKMYTDILVLDECRYIYEWLPTIHQVQNAFRNLSWQYVFRFALDGLVKQRINYNNEYFFQGSVIGKHISNFKSKIIKERINIE